MAELQQLIDSGNLDQLDNLVSEFAREFVAATDDADVTRINNNNSSNNNVKESNNNPTNAVK